MNDPSSDKIRAIEAQIVDIAAAIPDVVNDPEAQAKYWAVVDELRRRRKMAIAERIGRSN